MKAYQLLSRLRYAKLITKEGKGYFKADQDDWDLIDERDKMYKELGKMGKLDKYAD